jgi:hypothetical protein
MKPVIGIFNSESKANEVIDTLKASGLDANAIKLISKNVLLRADDEPPGYVDPNANIFNQDHNGIDIPLGEENIVFDSVSFADKIQSILSGIMDSSQLQSTIQRAEEAGYVVVVEADSTEDFTKASGIVQDIA